MNFIGNLVNYKMKYETLSGEIKDTEAGKTILRFLRIGDRFSNKNGEGLWVVLDERCSFNAKAGSATRRCKNLKTDEVDYKLCRIAVIKK